MALLHNTQIIDGDAASASSACLSHSKSCTLCSTPRDVLVRCQIDLSGKWHFVCPGKCWKDVSGGTIDGDDSHSAYRYGGMWKNKHDAVSAKRKKKGNAPLHQNIRQWQPPPGEDVSDQHSVKYTMNDKVTWNGKTWVCRRSHQVGDDKMPSERNWRWWKEAG